jgi:hypothetical protein
LAAGLYSSIASAPSAIAAIPATSVTDGLRSRTSVRSGSAYATSDTSGTMAKAKIATLLGNPARTKKNIIASNFLMIPAWN